MTCFARLEISAVTVVFSLIALFYEILYCADPLFDLIKFCVSIVIRVFYRIENVPRRAQWHSVYECSVRMS